MLNSVVGMVEKGRNAMAILRERALNSNSDLERREVHYIISTYAHFFVNSKPDSQQIFTFSWAFVAIPNQPGSNFLIFLWTFYIAPEGT